ncbi:MAG: hypothetical protein WC428_07475 [Candidatus Paceibacterota bacterium]
MKRNSVNLVGMRFGRLVVIKNLGVINGHTSWECKCDCDNIVKTTTSRLVHEYTQSCGCLQKYRASETSKTHGMRHTRLYRCWFSMLQRCKNIKDAAYKDYGGRGIIVCGEWGKFEAFRDWAMASGYADDLTIDRIDNSGNYEPSNCKWSTMKEQNNNKRWNRLFSYNGKTQNIAQWADETNIPYKTLHRRLTFCKWPMEKALTEPIHNTKRKRPS